MANRDGVVEGTGMVELPVTTTGGGGEALALQDLEYVFSGGIKRTWKTLPCTHGVGLPNTRYCNVPTPRPGTAAIFINTCGLGSACSPGMFWSLVRMRMMNCVVVDWFLASMS